MLTGEVPANQDTDDSTGKRKKMRVLRRLGCTQLQQGKSSFTAGHYSGGSRDGQTEDTTYVPGITCFRLRGSKTAS